MLGDVLFFNDPPHTEIYTLSLHDALPISPMATKATARMDKETITSSRVKPSLARFIRHPPARDRRHHRRAPRCAREDRKSTRLNSSHSQISYAVFCLKKKKNQHDSTHHIK